MISVLRAPDMYLHFTEGKGREGNNCDVTVLLSLSKFYMFKTCYWLPSHSTMLFFKLPFYETHSPPITVPRGHRDRHTMSVLATGVEFYRDKTKIIKLMYFRLDYFSANKTKIIKRVESVSSH